LNDIRKISEVTVHMIKLCVGPDNVEELALRQNLRKKQMNEVFHVTRMYPRRAKELIQNGSIYWVIKGLVQVRQRIIDIQKFRDAEGVCRCKLFFDPKLTQVHYQPRRAFQGWRYLEPEDAPPDMVIHQDEDALPDKLRKELLELCLI